MPPQVTVTTGFTLPGSHQSHHMAHSFIHSITHSPSPSPNPSTRLSTRQPVTQTIHSIIHSPSHSPKPTTHPVYAQPLLVRQLHTEPKTCPILHVLPHSPSHSLNSHTQLNWRFLSFAFLFIHLGCLRSLFHCQHAHTLQLSILNQSIQFMIPTKRAVSNTQDY